MRISDWSSDVCSSDLFKAVARSILASPANHVDDVELLADVFDSADPRAYGVLPFPRTDFGEKSGDAMIAECIAYGRQGTDPKEDPDADKIGRAHVCTPITNAHLVCRLLLEKQNNHHAIHRPSNTVLY